MTPKLYYKIEQDASFMGYFVYERKTDRGTWWPITYRLTLWGARRFVKRLQTQTLYVETFEPITQIVNENATSSPSTIQAPPSGDPT